MVETAAHLDDDGVEATNLRHARCVCFRLLVSVIEPNVANAELTTCVAAPHVNLIIGHGAHELLALQAHRVQTHASVLDLVLLLVRIDSHVDCTDLDVTRRYVV